MYPRMKIILKSLAPPVYLMLTMLSVCFVPSLHGQRPFTHCVFSVSCIMYIFCIDCLARFSGRLRPSFSSGISVDSDVLSEAPILQEQKYSVNFVANCYAALELRSLPLPMDFSSAWTQLDELDLLALCVFSNAVTVLEVAINRLAPQGCLL